MQTFHFKIGVISLRVLSTILASVVCSRTRLTGIYHAFHARVNGTACSCQLRIGALVGDFSWKA